MSIFNASKSFQMLPSKKGANLVCWLRFTVLFIVTLLLGLPGIQAQDSEEGGLEIYSTYGYMFGGYLRTYDGQINIGDDDNFKIGLNYTIAPGTQLEIHWMHQSSDVRITEYGGLFEYENQFDLNTDYFQIGVLKELKPGPVRPFGKFTIGTAVFSPQDNRYDDLWRFAFTMGGGIKAYLSEKVGIRISGSMMMPIYFSGLNFWCGTGGCSTGIGTGSAILQGELSAGLFISLQ